MKRCPECHAQYDDHVEYCFVDGADLVEDEDAGTPVSSGTPAAAPPPPTNRARSSLLLLLLLGAGFVVLLLGVGVTVAVVSGSGSEPELTKAAVPDPVTPPPAPVPVPEPEPEPQVVKLGFTSTPEGADVWEGDTMLCTTPCTIDHPEHAPIPRTFVLKARRYRDTEHIVDDPTLPQHVSLRRRAQPRPTPAPTVAAKPDPVPQPAPAPSPAPSPSPSPSPTSDDGLGVQTNDLVDPWED